MTRGFFAETRWFVLLCIVAVPVAAGSFLLLAPPTVFSREMTWDLLFNLEGAWSLWDGQQLHVDVHDPLGVVTFGLTALGFQIAGIGPRAFLVGETLYAYAMLAAAICIVPRRLPPIAAAIATLYVVLLALVPTNLGDPIETYSFAMSYNRFGWSTLTLLFIVLFLAPRRQNGAWLDLGVAFLLNVLLFFLKITYFGVGVAAIAIAFFLSPHVRRHRKAWLGVLAALAVVAAAPINAPYWSDILTTIQSGAVRLDIVHEVRNVVASRDTAIIGTELLCLLCLRRAGISLHRLASALFIIACGAFILSQNQQFDGIALYVVVALLLFDSARIAFQGPMMLPAREAGLLLGAVLIAPTIHVALMGASLAGYYIKAAADDNEIVDDTNLRGLAVSPEQPDLITLFSKSPVAAGLLNASRLKHPQYELTQAEYLKTILEAARMIRGLMVLNGTTRPPRIGLLDSVNPLPFMLGLPPSQDRLWLDPGFPWPHAKDFLGRLDYVLVPKFPTDSASARMARGRYDAFLTRHFRRTETESWIIFRRDDGISARAGL